MGKNEIVKGGKPVKLIFLPAVVLATSLNYSMRFTAGIIVGYVLCKIFCMTLVNNGKIDSIFFDYGRWRVHLHHWIMGAAVLGLLLTVDLLYLPTFFAGAICGIILQDIYDYNDWHKIIVRNEEYENI